MASEPFSKKRCNPFADDLFADGEVVGAEEVILHPQAWERMEEWVDQVAEESPARAAKGQGRIILLKAPRAGYGKSYLLNRLQQASTAGKALVVPIEPRAEENISWKLLFERVLGVLDASTTEARRGAPSLLDEVTRRLFARVNAGMLASGEVPCADPAAAAGMLEAGFMELFDFGRKDQPVAQWFQEHFEQLLPLSAGHVQEWTGIGLGASAGWLRALCGYAQAGADRDPARLGSLHWALRQPVEDAPGSVTGAGGILQAPEGGDLFYRKKLGELSRLTAVFKPLVICLDHLDGFHGNGEKVLQLANFLNEWRRMSGRLRFFLSVNHDLWTQTFLKVLPSALEDRMTSGQITLGGISREAAEDLVQSRLDQWEVPEALADAFFQHLDLGQYFAQEAGRMVSPRAVLRFAGQAWQEPWDSARPAARAGSPSSRSGLKRYPAPQQIPSSGEGAPTSFPAPGVASAPPSRAPISPSPADPLPKPGEIPVPDSPHSPEALAAVRPDRPSMPPAPRPPGYSNGSPASPPQGGSGAILPDPVPATPRSLRPGKPSGQSPFLAAARPAPDQALQSRFHILRNHFASSPWLVLDQDRLYHLMKLSGQRLALVRFLETGLPGLSGALAGVWQSPDAEILFGSEPYEDRKYWAALVDFARQRSSYVPGSRLVVFSSAAAPVDPAIWAREGDPAGADFSFVDVQTLDHPGLAALYATDEVLRECERGALPLNASDGFAAMAPYLENLWKRLTRPVAGSSTPHQS